MKILLVDDSATMRKISGMALKARGYELFEAINGQDALGKLKEGLIPDLFLVDVNMPVMNGPDFVKAMQQQESFKTIPVIFLTTESESGFSEELQNLNVTAWLNKPYKKDDLYAILDRL